MKQGPARIARGLLSDPATPIGFQFDGQALQGQAGDTLAAALLANGRRLVARSFKYHRPRGILTAGPEEPCALVDVLGPQGREPNRLATTLELHEGLVALSQNRWPSLRFDLGAINDLLGRFIPAGFYYKTFMAPGWAWERVYEPLIRRAAGLGRLQPQVAAHAAPAETVHEHCDVLVVGAGAAGLAAAWRLGANGQRVLLVEQDVCAGGGLLLDARWTDWRERALAAYAQFPQCRLLTRTAVIGAYGHGVFGALQTLTAAEANANEGLRERLRVIRAQRVLFATGATERLIALPGNDLPGVMLAGSALAYLRRHGVVPGRRPVFFLNNDEAYDAVVQMTQAGVRGAVVDVRPESAAATRARALGIEVHAGAVVEAVHGRQGVSAVSIAAAGAPRRRLAADSLLLSGGHTPASALPTQLGAALDWREDIAGFVPTLDARIGHVAGALAGATGLATCVRDGDAAAAAIVGALRGVLSPSDVLHDLPADPETSALAAVWEVRTVGAAGRALGKSYGKSFVDLQNDVTSADIRLAVREGYSHVEHMKRFTTHGMATDHGRIGGLVGSAVLAAERGLPLSQVGMSRPRPFTAPVPFAALGGAEVRAHFKPRRRLPLHDWHEQAGATFVNAGIWLRPLVYSPQAGWDPVLREARAVRRCAGITDVSSLGKIDVRGADAARFLDFIYANTFSTLAVGRARYGIMLREDGMLLDDGTTSRLGAAHFLITTTTANHAAVLEHLEFQLQANCMGFDVLLTDVTDHWAQFAVAGPRARDVVAAAVGGLDLSNAAFPFMAAGEGTIGAPRVPVRVFRISFSGELAYELAVPAREALPAWLALLEAGRPHDLVAYGLDALNTLRIEKGHVTGAELNGNSSADDLGFGRMLKKSGDFIGRVLSQRRPPGRLQLVALRAVDAQRRLRNGAQLLAPQDSATSGGSLSLGFVTSSTPSVATDGWVGLALLQDGRERHGQRLRACSPLHGEDVEVQILSAHWLDAENSRVRA